MKTHESNSLIFDNNLVVILICSLNTKLLGEKDENEKNNGNMFVIAFDGNTK